MPTLCRPYRCLLYVHMQNLYAASLQNKLDTRFQRAAKPAYMLCFCAEALNGP